MSCLAGKIFHSHNKILLSRDENNLLIDHSKFLKIFCDLYMYCSGSSSAYTFASTSRHPNDKWLISQFLSTWFLRQRSIPNRIRHKYFYCLQSLLLQQWRTIQLRLSSVSLKNCETKTYIRFSYKRTVFHLGFYLPCV